ncbi:MAG: hypothetical protein JO354_13890 [Verrucomicrobia bacterium]|nr:hypothetical protein [Verrucomicrobiota bacterium]
MDEFSYLSVLLSIILGLAVTQILIGLRGRMLTRARVRDFWPVQVWAALFLVIAAQTWWAMFGLRERRQWDFAGFAILLAQVIALYLLTGLVYPDFNPEKGTDLHAHYFRQRYHFFTLLIFAVVLSICRDLILNHSLPSLINLSFHLAFIGLAVSGLAIARERYHKLLALVVAAVFASYVVLLFTRLE